jgi:hypothetical protein
MYFQDKFYEKNLPFSLYIFSNSANAYFLIKNQYLYENPFIVIRNKRHLLSYEGFSSLEKSVLICPQRSILSCPPSSRVKQPAAD